MSLYKAFGTNKIKENKGIPIEYAPYADGRVPTFYVARQARGNTKYRRCLKELYKPYQKQLRAGIPLQDDVSEKLGKIAFIRGCLAGWQNICDKDGNEIEFSEKAAEALFSDLPDLLDDLMEQSTNITNYQDETVEEDAKN
jgi:hypothetical protein